MFQPYHTRRKISSCRQRMRQPFMCLLVIRSYSPLSRHKTRGFKNSARLNNSQEKVFISILAIIFSTFAQMSYQTILKHKDVFKTASCFDLTLYFPNFLVSIFYKPFQERYMSFMKPQKDRFYRTRIHQVLYLLRRYALPHSLSHGYTL